MQDPWLAASRQEAACKTRRALLTAIPVLATSPSAFTQVLDPGVNKNAVCIAPAKLGGGFDLTCRLAAKAIDGTRSGDAKTLIQYLPGGIGALAYDKAATQQLGDERTLIAFSSGSLLNIAQGRFGPHSIASVNWLGVLAADYGVVAVRADSPYRSLDDLLRAIRANPAAIPFGAGGTVGSQDWIKAARLVRAAGRDPREMRFVAFEGGGEALRALAGGHVVAFPGDAAEAQHAISAGERIRILAILASDRVPGKLAHIPTAIEQGVDVTWMTVRGLYMAAGTHPSAIRYWSDTLQKAMGLPGYMALLENFDLYPYSLVGRPLQEYLKQKIQEYREDAEKMGVRIWRNRQ